MRCLLLFAKDVFENSAYTSCIVATLLGEGSLWGRLVHVLILHQAVSLKYCIWATRVWQSPSWLDLSTSRHCLSFSGVKQSICSRLTSWRPSWRLKLLLRFQRDLHVRCNIWLSLWILLLLRILVQLVKSFSPLHWKDQWKRCLAIRLPSRAMSNIEYPRLCASMKVRGLPSLLHSYMLPSAGSCEFLSTPAKTKQHTEECHMVLSRSFDRLCQAELVRVLWLSLELFLRGHKETSGQVRWPFACKLLLETLNRVLKVQISPLLRAWAIVLL